MQICSFTKNRQQLQDVAATPMVPVNSILIWAALHPIAFRQSCVEPYISLTAGNFNLRLPDDLEPNAFMPRSSQRLNTTIYHYFSSFT